MRETLDILTNGVIASPDDLMGMGECLNLLDELEKARFLSEERLYDLQRVKRLFNGIILEDSHDPEADWRSIQGLVDRICAEKSEESDENAPAIPPLDDPVGSDWEIIQNLVQETEEEEDQRLFEITASAKPDVPERDFEKESPACNREEETEIQDPDLLRDFLEEAKENLSSIELNILSLEANPGDLEAINAIFRPFHSIKGVAGFLNLKDIHHLSHEAENLLDEARSNKLSITDEVIDLILKAEDFLKSMLADVENSLNQGVPIPPSANLVTAFCKHLDNFHTKEISGPGTAAKKVGEILVEREVIGPEEVEVAAASSKSKGRKLGEELITEGVATARDVSSALREQRHVKENAASVRIDTHKLDNLVDMVGELVIAQSMVLQSPEVQCIKEQKFQKDSVQLRRITNELQRIAMSMRMVPIKSTFQKMIRLVRDVSKKSGKETILEMKGEETEIDRNMVEEIYEPLVHMIRNAIDHGIEPPHERKEAGKDPQGTILIAAEQKGGNIVIDIADDGRGMDADKIQATAIKRNIISPDEPMDEKSIYELIFHPGFSTKDKITEVSGRGVGMDVVKKSVERLRGKVETSSVPGKGSRFQLKFPLTMAITDGMIIQVGNERYVVPTIALRESFRPGKEQYMTVQGKGELIKVRNTLMPLIRLHEVFNVQPRHYNPWDGLLLVINEDNRSCCLLADEIVGRQEVVIKSLGQSLRDVSGISGGAILGDGRVALIIDVKGIVNHYEENLK